MVRLLRVSALIGIVLWASAAGLARAIPWDEAGVIPPGRTPPATRPDPLCRQSYADDRPRPGPPLTFGIGPSIAGESGTTQATPVVPEDRLRRDAALRRLAGGHPFVVRLNRLFESDGRAGIRRFQAQARHYGRLGLQVELQVRYHPTPAQNGNLRRWLAFVRAVVRAFGPLRNVTALQITNEVNVTFSPNTSDGAYRKAVPALVDGVIAAKRLAVRRGYHQLSIGFNYAWRFDPTADAAFWRALRRQGGGALRRSADWVGIDLYPGTYNPPQATVVNEGDAFLEGLAEVRKCYMPLAGFTRHTPIRIEETGWPTGPGRSEVAQAQALRAIVTTASAYRGTYNITDLRWFDLRDNNSRGPTFESYFGLLRDDYRPKPAFAVFRRLIARLAASPKHGGFGGVGLG